MTSRLNPQQRAAIAAALLTGQQRVAALAAQYNVSATTIRRCLPPTTGRRQQIPRQDLTGRTFGKWTVVQRFSKPPGVPGYGSGMYWVCRCACGELHTVLGRSLANGTSTQCKACAGRQSQANRRNVSRET